MATRKKGDSFERSLTERQIALLEAFEVRGNVARYTGTDTIPDWKVVKEVFTKLGGTWKRSDGFTFPPNVDAAALLANTLATGSIFDPALAGFFPTPMALAERMAAWAIVGKYDLVLEPSAGTGALVRAARKAGGRSITAIEVQKDLCASLRSIPTDAVHNRRFQDFKTSDVVCLFDAVLMNPPFASDEWRDIGHVTHALGFLKPGGRLAAIVGAGARFRTTKAHVAFRARLDALGAVWEDLPPDTFREAGTSVRTCLVRVELPR